MKEINVDALTEKAKKFGGNGKKIVISIAALIILWIAVRGLNPFVLVGAGERGVVLNFGAVQQDVLGEGLHLRVPVMQKIALVDVRIQKSQTDAESVSKDLQDTKSVVAVNYHASPDKVNKIYQNIGTEFKDRIVDPAVQEVVKAITARYTAVELITQREKVRNEIKDLLRQRLITYDIIVDDFSIVNFRFSQQFEAAIEAKQTAEQLAFKAQRDLERIKIEADQKIASAKAEAESLRLQKENVTPQLIQLRKIEASIKAIEKWDGHMPKITSGAVPFIDMKSLEDK
ncbi:MAG TPA: prohibitin family protein [Thermodesulfovibrionales bacterium]|jgi:regulator of protease activity HflC (stomatin/prohibitin superfamily)|nr:prohibitin family protein [Thermodesulfovibrionales bacterium]